MLVAMNQYSECDNGNKYIVITFFIHILEQTETLAIGIANYAIFFALEAEFLLFDF